jgi:hypothetical protein
VTENNQHLPEGPVVLDLRCPNCGAPVSILAAVGAVLTTPSDDVPTLRAKLRAKPAAHLCGQGDLFSAEWVATEVEQ